MLIYVYVARSKYIKVIVIVYGQKRVYIQTLKNFMIVIYLIESFCLAQIPVLCILNIIIIDSYLYCLCNCALVYFCTIE